MRNRSSYNREAFFRSYCEGFEVSGTAKQVYERWNALGDQADKVGDRVASQRFKQQAEHYIKLNKRLV